MSQHDCRSSVLSSISIKLLQQNFFACIYTLEVHASENWAPTLAVIGRDTSLRVMNFDLDSDVLCFHESGE
ncbi:uncharacterized protein LOC112493696 isoform X2 [Cephus cinctus]|uniref:Uncharacterized protein LOC112493696 isoform X2 n=1 Tax=Cephus cinctus TaxID=211228 RepID=A0AAJ7R8Y3_CEPCN|nr:uncharacterized protein LOC112493696 isoform X2 [Cephus cinctus]